MGIDVIKIRSQFVPNLCLLNNFSVYSVLSVRALLTRFRYRYRYRTEGFRFRLRLRLQSPRHQD